MFLRLINLGADGNWIGEELAKIELEKEGKGARLLFVGVVSGLELEVYLNKAEVASFAEVFQQQYLKDFPAPATVLPKLFYEEPK